MRTTVAIDDDVLEAAERCAGDRGQTLSQLVEDALRRELTAGEPDDTTPVPVSPADGGLRAGLDPRSNRALREALDEGAPDALR